MRPLPELQPYLDEPPQLPSGTPGKDGYLFLGFERQGEKSILRRFERRVPLLVQQALYWDEAMPGLPCVVIISNAGGVVQGDRYAVEIELGPQAQAHVTTQAATKIHQMEANYALQTQHIRLAEGAYLEYLPEVAIPHRGARFVTHTTVSVHPGATLLYSEILAAGRKYHIEAGGSDRDQGVEGSGFGREQSGCGELFRYDLFSSLVRGERQDGSELFTEKFLIEPARGDPRRSAVLGAYHVFANVLLLTPREHADRIFEQVPATIDVTTKIASGASRLPNEAGLIYKVLGLETEAVRAKVREFWSLTRTTVTGCQLMPEFAWR